MGEAEISEIVRNVLAEQLCVPTEAIRMDATLAWDLGADSLDTIELALLLEQALSMEIPDDAAEGVRTVGDLVSGVVSLRLAAA